jgi:hypothetical protein
LSVLDSVNWTDVRQHYDVRVQVHKDLQKLRQQNAVDKFTELALGISDNDGNYSAAEHGLGPKVLAFNAQAGQRVFDLAGQFISLTDASKVPELIKRAQLKYLQIGVGSEISCMVNPEICWVANTRTIWTHLVIKHGYDVSKADEELKLYREADVTSEMAYEAWAEIHAKLDVALTHVAKLGRERAKSAKVTPGSIIYIWADAIASHLYSSYHD